MLTEALFAGIAAESRRRLAREGAIRMLAEGDTLFHRGDEAEELFAVEHGRIRIWRASESGEAVTLMFAATGEVIGSVALAQRRPYVVSATAMGDVTVRSWRGSLFRDLFVHDAVLATHVAELLAGRAASLAERLEEIAAGPIDQRIARTLVRLSGEIGREGEGGGIDMQLSRRDLADLTHTTLPTVSRVMSRWRAVGIVDGGGRGRVRILKLDELCAIGRIDC